MYYIDWGTSVTANGTVTRQYYAPSVPSVPSVQPESPAHREAREAESARRDVEEHDANAKAEALLTALAGPELVAEWRARGHIEIPSRLKPGCRYRIKPRDQIKLIDAQGNAIESLCVRVKVGGPYPPADDIIWKALLAQHDEERLLATAVHTLITPVRA